MRLDEAGLLRAFDSNRDLICATAAKVYARGHEGSYDLVSCRRTGDVLGANSEAAAMTMLPTETAYCRPVAGFEVLVELRQPFRNFIAAGQRQPTALHLDKLGLFPLLHLGFRSQRQSRPAGPR